jgi:flagellar protein FliS
MVNAALRYKQMNAESGAQSATPHQLILMLFNGAVERINQAKGHMQRGNIPEKGLLISKAIAIVGELQASLDLKVGGDLAENLFLLYDYINRRLLAANAENNVDYLDEAATLIKEIKSAWEEMPREYQTMSEQEKAQLTVS